MSKAMQPIRTHELNHWSNVVSREFSERTKALETTLFQEVKDKATAYQSTFNKKIKVDNKLDAIQKAEKALEDFQSSKEATELQLKKKVAVLINELQTDLAKWDNVRGWDCTDYRSAKSHKDFTDFLEDVCYDEVKELYMKSEKGKPLTELKKAESEAHNCLHSGGSITETVESLSTIFKACKIDVRIPKKLLQIGN